MAEEAFEKKAIASEQGGGFKLTYATMFHPPEVLHTSFDRAVAMFRSEMGRDIPMLINGRDRFGEDTFDNRSPINTHWLLGTFQRGGVREAREALAAARAAAPKWAATPWKDRVRIVRRAVALMEKRLYDISAIVAMEVGKNRLEALGDVQETIDLIAYYCNQMEDQNGFVKRLAEDPLAGYKVLNLSVLKPYGVWVVIAPFNFPFALAGGPSGAALVAGNTVVCKPASDTPYSGRLLAECFRDAGLPDGAFNYVTGGGATLGQELISRPMVDGITFTGSHAVGMHIYRTFASGAYPRPCIAEMGGKNAAIVTRKADLETAVQGVLRSAFGLQGQKCSACSRIFVDNAVKDRFTRMLIDRTAALTIGDPTQRENFLGPVANETAYRDYAAFSQELREGGSVLIGGEHLTEGDLGEGYYCAPTLAELPLHHRLWKVEMFLPIATLAGFDDLRQAIDLANEGNYALTAGFYGAKEEAQEFFDRILAGVTYANRPQGATSGAWPGFQPFGGWKGSSSTGKGGGSLYYLPQYMHEQGQTIVEKG